MSSRVDVLLWAQRVIARKGGAPHEQLEIAAEATLDQAQEAFHKLAKMAHPDLHRTTLDAGELEKVTTAYAYVAAAYQAIRVAKLRATPGRPPGVPTERPAEAPRVKRPSEAARNVVLPGGGIVSGRGSPGTRPPLTKPASTPPAAADKPRTTGMPPIRAAEKVPEPPPPMADPPTLSSSTASASMNGKALVYYRKAEMALRQGDLRMAVLNLKMAIAADPVSTFLRQAMAEVESELKAK